MKISVVQSMKRFSYDVNNPGEYDFNLCRKLSVQFMQEGFEMVEKAGSVGSQLIVTIEGFNYSINPDDRRYDFKEACEKMDGPVINRFSTISARYGTYIVAGLFTRKGGKAYNSGILFGPDGDIKGVYEKVHLPAGEYPAITPGDEYRIFETEYGKIGILICWDMQYPEAPRELALAGVDLIACPTWGWENIYGLCRAYENSVTIASAMGVHSNGVVYDFCDPSCIVDNMGRIISSASRSGPQIVTCEVDIAKDPEPQYGAGAKTGLHSMRHIRLMQRRPDTYRLVTEKCPPVLRDYDKNYRKN